MRALGMAVLLVALGAFTVLAAGPEERLADPALEGRARALFAELRCVVCQNQSIDDSDAQVAADLRRVVRERLQAGFDENAIRAFLAERYGDFVLLRPPLRPGTWLLWLMPIALLLAGAVWLAGIRRRRVPPSEPGLDADEERRLSALVSRGP